MFNPTPEEVTAIKQKYGLEYHTHACKQADDMVGFAGKRVLEVGGSLNREFVFDHLGVKSWISIEEMSYWKEVLSTGDDDRPPPKPATKLVDVVSAESLPVHDILDGSIEELPASLHHSFDMVFSIACFEHIHRMPAALAAMHAALVPGGKLFSKFSPIWSSHDGHHIPEIKDEAGNRFSFTHCPIPHWGHLRMRPAEMLHHLAQKTDINTARNLVYYIYQGSHINRFFVEDYLGFVQQSPFVIEHFDLVYNIEVPATIQSELEKCHPGRKYFGNNGLLLVLRKDA